MQKIKLKSFPIPCQKCGKSISIQPHEFKIGNKKKCPHCGLFTVEFTEDLERTITDSIKKAFRKFK